MKTFRIEHLVILILSILFSLFTFTSTSPLYPDEGVDSVIFKSMGLAILEGKTPYVDYFDHKGPILYFINAAGQWLLSGDSGIFLLEILATFIVFLLLFQSTLIIGCRKWTSWLALGLGLLYYYISNEGGNTCEEWELLAIALVTYLSLCYVYQKETCSPIIFGAIVGLCFCYCFFIRPNDAVSQIGGLMMGGMLVSIYRKEWPLLWKWGCGWAIGAIVLSLPIFLFFVYRNALGDFYYGLISHNLIYAGHFLSTLLSKKKIIMLFFFLVSVIVLYQKNHSMAVLLLPAFLLGWLLLGERTYLHYYTVFIPILVVTTASTIQDENHWKKAFFFLSFAFFFTINIQSVAQLRYNLGAYENKAQNEFGERQFQQEARRLIEMVPIEERDSIWNYNLSFNKTGVFWQNGVMQMNRIPFYDMAFVDPLLAETDRIQEKCPLWVTLTHENDCFCQAAGKEVGRLFDYFRPGYDFIEKNYDRIARTDTTICDIELWRRRDVIDNTLVDEKL